MSATMTMTKSKSKTAPRRFKVLNQEPKEQPVPKLYVYPETEEERTEAFRYLYELEKRTGAASAWDLLPAFTVQMDKSKSIAEQYIIEYLTQPEKVIRNYIPRKDQVYGPTHYKTLSAQLSKFYEFYPPY